MKKPRALHVGDKVAVVSLSSGMLGEAQFIHKYELAKERMERIYGLKVIPMPNALKGIDYLYQHPEARAADFMEAFQNPEIKAVFNAIGGDDTIRLLPYIDFEVLRNNPKIFTGFSDSTTNHFMLYKAGVVSYYGLSVMNQWAEYVEINPYTKQFIDKMLFHPTSQMKICSSDFCSYDCDKIWWGEEHMNEETPCYPNTGYEILQGNGTVTGQLLGGCIDVFLELLGTSLWPSLDDWRGKILLLETSESNMSADVLSWLLRNLLAQRILHVISGIIVGKPAYQEKEEEYKAVYRQVIAKEAGLPQLPILFNVNVGHAYPTGLFPLGLTYKLDADTGSLYLMEPATEI